MAVLAAASVLALNGGGSRAAEDCSPNGTALSLTAFDSKFDKRCLAAPADTPFTIDFKNLDRGIPHNMAIFKDDTGGERLFKGELLDGPGQTTYEVPALPAGTFVFRCEPHPEMNGTFIVR
jgi:plastocyanin